MSIGRFLDRAGAIVFWPFLALDRWWRARRWLAAQLLKIGLRPARWESNTTRRRRIHDELLGGRR